MINMMNRNSINIIVIILLGLLQLGCVFVPLGQKKSRFDPPEPVVTQVPRRDNGAIFQQGMTIGLFDRITARSVGDIITIVLKENTNTSATANTNATKDQKVDLRAPTLAGSGVTNEGKEVLKNNIDAGREFSGQGTSAQSSTLSGHITVTVSKVQANGNLFIIGQKMMLLNQSSEFIRLSGIIRPQDIQPDNTIDSFRVADVKVAYSGDGVLSSANAMGPLARFFQSGVWPY